MRTACDHFFDALLDGPLPPEQLAHAVVCESCRALIGDHQTSGGSPPQPNATLGAVFREELRTEAHATLEAHPRAWPWWGTALALLGLNAGVALAAAARLGTDNWALGNASTGRMAVAAAGLGVALLGGVFAAIMPRGRALRAGLGWMSVAVPALVLLGADGQGVCITVRQALPCALTELGLALLPATLGVLALTQVAFRPLRTWLLGVAAGSVGLFVLHLHCLDGSAQHLVLYHLVPWALVCGLTVLVRWRLPTRGFAP